MEQFPLPVGGTEETGGQEKKEKKLIRPKTIAGFIAQLEDLLKNYEGGVPEEIKDSTKGNWKIRDGWFTLVVGRLEMLSIQKNPETGEPLIPKGLNARIATYVDRLDISGRKNTQKDIDEGVEILNLVIAELKEIDSRSADPGKQFIPTLNTGGDGGAEEANLSKD